MFKSVLEWPDTPLKHKLLCKMKENLNEEEFVDLVQQYLDTLETRTEFDAFLSKLISTKHDDRQCSYCHTLSTPMWRQGPENYKILCNSCGVKWRRGRILLEPLKSSTEPLKSPIEPKPIAPKIKLVLKCSRTMPYSEWKKSKPIDPLRLDCPKKRALYLSEKFASMPLPLLASVMLSLPYSLNKKITNAVASGRDGELDTRDLSSEDWLELVRMCKS